MSKIVDMTEMGTRVTFGIRNSDDEMEERIIAVLSQLQGLSTADHVRVLCESLSRVFAGILAAKTSPRLMVKKAVKELVPHIFNRAEMLQPLAAKTQEFVDTPPTSKSSQ
jgi:hypothetical protein